MTTYPPNVERWRTLVTQILREVGGPQFNPEDINKLLHVIKYESGGDPNIAGDNGDSIGLTQLNTYGLGSGMTTAQRKDPTTNIRKAAEAIYSNLGWTPWGEGNLYKGQVFGSLGNHPYVTSEVLGTFKENNNMPADAAQAGDYPTIKPEPGTGSWNIGSVIKGTIKDKKQELKKSFLPPQQLYSPTGDFTQDAGGYWSLAQNAWAEIDRIQQGEADPLIVDEEQGLVINGRTGLIHDQATRWLQIATTNEANLERLYAAKQAGLMDSGESAAAAYLTSEKEKAAEATRKYEDYVKRVSDLVAFEDIPVARQKNLADMLSSVNAANAANQGKKQFSGMLASGGSKQNTDTSQFADAIKSTIPSTAPAPYDINQGALAPVPTASSSYQARPPDEILASVQSGGYTGPSPAARYGPGMGVGPVGPAAPTQGPGTTGGPMGPQVPASVVAGNLASALRKNWGQF